MTFSMALARALRSLRTVRALALRRASLIFEMHSSTGLKSGEYLGICLTLAPAVLIMSIARSEYWNLTLSSIKYVVGDQTRCKEFLDILVKDLCVYRSFDAHRRADSA
jgi:hypothetical protein